MKKKLTSNLGLKILALLFSFILWLVVVNINDPIKTISYSGIKVEVINEDAITDQGKVYEILENTGTVTVSVTANRSTFDSISQENIRAVADMKEISFMDTVRINAYCNKNSDEIESIASNTENLKLNIEDIKKVQLVISPVAVGKPADNYVLGDISTNQNIVRMSGPESVISKVSKAVVTVDVGGMTSSINTNAELKLYDAEDNLIDSTNIKKNIDEVTVSAQILATKEVPIICQIESNLAEGYMLTGEVLTEPQTITLAGSRKALEAVKQVDIPPTAFEETAQSTDIVQTIDIRKYLPEGTILADTSFNGKVEVTARVEKAVAKTFEVPVKNFVLSNVPAGLTGSIVETEGTVTVELLGLKEVMDTITENNIRGILDVGAFMENAGLTNLDAGNWQIDVVFALPEGAEASNDLKMEASFHNSEQ